MGPKYTCLKCDLLKDCIDKEHFTQHMVEFHQLNPEIHYYDKMTKHTTWIDKPHTMEYTYRDGNGEPFFMIEVRCNYE